MDVIPMQVSRHKRAVVVIAASVVALVFILPLAFNLSVWNGLIPGAVKSTSNSISMPFSKVPASFDIQGYQFKVVYSGTGYMTRLPNGSAYANFGYSIVLGITYENATQNLTSGWDSYGPQQGHLPYPTTASAFGGNVTITWYLQAATVYLRINVR